MCDHIAVDARVKGRKASVYLLSDHVRIMACLDLEGAVVCPQVDRVCDAGDSTLEDLAMSVCADALTRHVTNHLCSFSPCNREF